MLWYSSYATHHPWIQFRDLLTEGSQTAITPVANSSSDCITSTLWFIWGFFSHSDTLLDFAQFGSQSRAWWHYQFCSMVYSKEEFRKYQLLACKVARAMFAEVSKETKQIHPAPTSAKKSFKVVKLNQRRRVKHSRSSESWLGPAHSQSSHTEQSGYCTLLFRALLFIF